MGLHPQELVSLRVTFRSVSSSQGQPEMVPLRGFPVSDTAIFRTGEHIWGSFLRLLDIPLSQLDRCQGRPRLTHTV